MILPFGHPPQGDAEAPLRAFRRVGMRTPNARRSTQYQFNIGSCRAPHPLRRAKHGIHQRAEVKRVPPPPIYRHPAAAGSPSPSSKQWFSAPRETRKHRFPLPLHAFTDTIRILLYVQHSKCKMFHVEHCRDLQVFLVFHVEQSLKPCHQRSPTVTPGTPRAPGTRSTSFLSRSSPHSWPRLVLAG